MITGYPLVYTVYIAQEYTVPKVKSGSQEGERSSQVHSKVKGHRRSTQGCLKVIGDIRVTWYLGVKVVLIKVIIN